MSCINLLPRHSHTPYKEISRDYAFLPRSSDEDEENEAKPLVESATFTAGSDRNASSSTVSCLVYMICTLTICFSLLTLAFIIHGITLYQRRDGKSDVAYPDAFLGLPRARSF
ncbi:hypothetical protein FPV67DRAFT_1680559 [Lyophyllum atratum]|nr:hypothetical protein FPV67DRAFT_1680559 [Lyophyllum atratum]